MNVFALINHIIWAIKLVFACNFWNNFTAVRYIYLAKSKRIIFMTHLRNFCCWVFTLNNSFIYEIFNTVKEFLIRKSISIKFPLPNDIFQFARFDNDFKESILFCNVDLLIINCPQSFFNRRKMNFCFHYLQ